MIDLKMMSTLYSKCNIVCNDISVLTIFGLHPFQRHEKQAGIYKIQYSWDIIKTQLSINDVNITHSGSLRWESIHENLYKKCFYPDEKATTENNRCKVFIINIVKLSYNYIEENIHWKQYKRLTQIPHFANSQFVQA